MEQAAGHVATPVMLQVLTPVTLNLVMRAGRTFRAYSPLQSSLQLRRDSDNMLHLAETRPDVAASLHAPLRGYFAIALSRYYRCRVGRIRTGAGNTSCQYHQELGR